MTLTTAQAREYRTLKDSGVDVTDTNRIRFNSGSETVPHCVSKCLVGLLGIRNGYRVDSEVDVENREYPDGEIDTLLWGHESRLAYAIEVETGLTEETKTRKLNQYVTETAIDDIQFVEVNTLPMDMVEAFGEIAAEIGLDP